MAINILESYENILVEFEDEVRSHPDADFTPYIQKIAAKLARLEKARERRVINTLLLYLYGKDAACLKRDLCHLQIPGAIKDMSSQRKKLLLYLYGVLSRYIEEITSRTWDEDDDVIFSGIQHLYMTIPDLKREHPGKLCICRPHVRDDTSGQVLSWMYFLAVDCVDAANVALALFDLNGMKDAVAISTTEQITLGKDLTDRYDRVFHGIEQCPDETRW